MGGQYNTVCVLQTQTHNLCMSPENNGHFEQKVLSASLPAHSAALMTLALLQ